MRYSHVNGDVIAVDAPKYVNIPERMECRFVRHTGPIPLRGSLPKVSVGTNPKHFLLVESDKALGTILIFMWFSIYHNKFYNFALHILSFS